MAEAETTDNKELTYGQKLVGAKFNPSADSVVDKLKQSAADMIDAIREVNNQEGVKEGTDEAFLSDYAIQSIVTAQMAAVKRATWKYNKPGATAAAGGSVDETAAAPDPGPNGNGTDAAPAQ